MIHFFKGLLKRLDRDDVFGLSAQLAYFFLLSLFPFLIFLVTLIGYLPLSDQAVLGMIKQYAPQQTYDLIDTNLNDIMNTQRGGLLSFGAIATIWSASNGINAVISAFNRAYEVTESRSFLKSRLMAIFLTIAMIFVIVIALLLPVFGKALGQFFFSLFGLSTGFLTVWNALRWVISFFVMMIVFLALYFIAPNRRLTLKEVIYGAGFATLGWQLVSLAFSYYVDKVGNFSATYGSIGSIIVLMTWFYLSALIILIGGEINAIIKSKKNSV